MRIFSFRSFLSLVLALSLLTTPGPVLAATLQDCKEDVVRALEEVIGAPGRTTLHGYLQQLTDLTSTSLPTHLLLDEVEQMARDARLELRGICREVSAFENLDRFYLAAYGLENCAVLEPNSSSTSDPLEILSFCQERSESLLSAFLDQLNIILMRQTIRTSIEPLLVSLRSLNGRLDGLVSQYARLINNFYTFSFRLGDTILGERD